MALLRIVTRLASAASRAIAFMELYADVRVYRANAIKRARKMRITATLLMWVALSGGMIEVLYAQDLQSASLPSMNDLRQEAVQLRQSVLTNTSDEREMLAAEARLVLDRFDKRITALRENIDDSKEGMNAPAARYADELLTALREQRGNVQQSLRRLDDSLGDNSANAWDRALYKFSSAYDSFIEIWEDVESNFPLESL